MLLGFYLRLRVCIISPMFKVREPLRSRWSIKGGFYSTQLTYATSYKYTNPNKLSYTRSFQKSNKPLPPTPFATERQTARPPGLPRLPNPDHQTAGPSGSSRLPSPDHQTVGPPGLPRLPRPDHQTAGPPGSPRSPSPDHQTVRPLES